MLGDQVIDRQPFARAAVTAGLGQHELETFVFRERPHVYPAGPKPFEQTGPDLLRSPVASHTLHERRARHREVGVRPVQGLADGVQHGARLSAHAEGQHSTLLAPRSTCQLRLKRVFSGRMVSAAAFAARSNAHDADGFGWDSTRCDVSTPSMDVFSLRDAVVGGQLDEVLAELRGALDRTPQKGPGNKYRREVLAQTLEHLRKNLHRMHYARLRRLDLDIGSGHVVGIRMDGPHALGPRPRRGSPAATVHPGQRDVGPV